MRNVLMTTALVLPLGFGAAFAQDAATTEPAADGTMTEQQPMATDTATDPAAGDAMATDGAAEGEMAAETDAETDAADEAMAAEAAEMVEVEQAANELRVDWITGETVMSPEGEAIGDVNDLIIDGDTGEMKAAIVGVGGFLGIGEKQIALPWTDLTINADAQEITATLTEEQAEAAPAYVFREQDAAEGEMTDAATGDATTEPMADEPMATGGDAPMTDPAAAPAEGEAMDGTMEEAPMEGENMEAGEMEGMEGNMEEAESDMTGNDPNAPETAPANN